MRPVNDHHDARDTEIEADVEAEMERRVEAWLDSLDPSDRTSVTILRDAETYICAGCDAAYERRP